MEYSSSSYSVSFCGRNIETTVTNKASVADHWLHNILQNRKTGEKKIIVGLDSKFKPHPIRSMSNKIATLQVCIDTKCLILQLLHMDSVPLWLKNLFNDNANNISLFGVKANEIASKLWREYGIRCSEMVDIRALVKIWFPVSYPRGEPSLKSLADRVLAGISMRKRKKDCLLDWEARVLDEELVEFACVDAYASYMIAHKLIKESIYI